MTTAFVCSTTYRSSLHAMQAGRVLPVACQHGGFPFLFTAVDGIRCAHHNNLTTV